MYQTANFRHVINYSHLLRAQLYKQDGFIPSFCRTDQQAVSAYFVLANRVTTVYNRWMTRVKKPPANNPFAISLRHASPCYFTTTERG